MINFFIKFYIVILIYVVIILYWKKITPKFGDFWIVPEKWPQYSPAFNGRFAMQQGCIERHRLSLFMTFETMPVSEEGWRWWSLSKCSLEVRAVY